MFKKIVLTLTVAAVLGLTGCSSSTNNGEGSKVEANETVDYAAQLEEIHTAIKEAYGENYLANMEYDAEMIEATFGLTEDMYDVVIANGPLMSAHVDTFVAVHPTEGNEAAVEEALTAYRNSQVEGTMMYPMNIAKVQACEVYKTDDYVFFIMLGGYTDEVYEDEAQELAAYQELNKIAVDTINSIVSE